MISATSTTVIIKISGNSIGSELSGMSPIKRRRIGAGETVNASKPTVIAPRFLPSRREIAGEIMNANTAEITTLSGWGFRRQSKDY